MTINEETQVITSLAKKQTGLGAVMHNASYEALHLNAVYIPITTNDIKLAIDGIRGLGICGSSVTMPYKQEVMQYLNVIDPTAKAIGAVNTISNENGVLTGYNSDWIGVTNALKEVTELKDKKVIVIGTGGAARAIVYGLVHEEAYVAVYGRSSGRAQDLADELGAELGGNLDALQSVNSYDIVINATSVGFESADSVLDSSFFQPNTIALDVVLLPARTTFLKDAEANGATTIPGSRMLVHQAVFQIETFTGEKAPLDIMEKALHNFLNPVTSV